MIKFTLKVMLARREMNQRELSEKAEVRLATISDICTNKIKHLPVEVLDKICAVLDCQPGDFVEYRKEES